MTQVKNFKLLAIKIRPGCSDDYCKNLRPGQLYRFYRSYEFQPKDNQTQQIQDLGNNFNLFDEFIEHKKQLSINVSAIVGKNGSGKSTLTELLFLSCYLLAVKGGMLQINERRSVGKRERSELQEIEEGLKLEVYYKLDSAFYCLVIDREFKAPEENLSNIQFIDVLKGVQDTQLKNLFYTIAVNYSIYGLNETLSGAWIGRLFHKNDGYQTPVVINPFRDKGTINVQAEIHFAQSRLLSNLMLNQDNRGEILPGKRVRHIKFIIDRAKISRLEGHAIERVIQELEISTGKSAERIFEQIYVQIMGEKLSRNSLENLEWRILTEKYVIGKVIKIAMNYPEYNIFFKSYSDEGVPGIQELLKYLKALKNDNTHITLKLRQALNFYKYDPLKANDKRIAETNNSLQMPVELFAERLDKITDQNSQIDLLEFIPLAPFTPRLILNNNIAFDRLSSGEQQYIHSLQAIVYHILNVNSVFNSTSDLQKVTYNNINVVLDEIELYFHPEFQRRFIKDLLRSLSKLKLNYITGINILLLTHSPFILSDIPVKNVLRLFEGKVDIDETPTLGGNIHQMLSTSFFMDSTIGDFASYQCDEILKFYEKVREPTTKISSSLKKQYKGVRTKFNFVISEIGEPVIKGILRNHLDYLDEKLEFNKPHLADKRSRLQNQIEILTQQLNELND